MLLVWLGHLKLIIKLKEKATLSVDNAIDFYYYCNNNNNDSNALLAGKNPLIYEQ